MIKKGPLGNLRHGIQYSIGGFMIFPLPIFTFAMKAVEIESWLSDIKSISSMYCTCTYIFLTLFYGVMWAVCNVQTIIEGPKRHCFSVDIIPVLINHPFDSPLLTGFITKATINDEEKGCRDNIIILKAWNERITPSMNRGGWLVIECTWRENMNKLCSFDAYL